MHHAERLIQRILFLEGPPVVSKLKAIRIGKNVEEIIGTDQDSEQGAVEAYNSAISLWVELNVQATADLLTTILKMEEGHVDRAEKQRAQIKQMGVQNYLANRVPGNSE